MNPGLNGPMHRHRLNGRDEQDRMVREILDRMRSRPPLRGQQTYVRREGGRFIEYVR